jgi:hypothetical protein
MRFAFRLLASLLAAVTFQASAQTATAVEYYYAAWNYYFVTSFPDEIAVLDGGAFGGVWKRTGQTFQVYTDASSGALATCRFFSTNFAPKSSHFYTPGAAECAGLKSNPDWQYESIAFYLQTPNAAGSCPAGTTILYRLYNNGMGGAPNHRYSTDHTTFQQMLAAGWVFEGNGNTGAFACVPQATANATAEGFYVGSMSGGIGMYGIVLDDGTYYVIHTLPNSNTIAGVGYGSLTSANGIFTSSSGLDFAIGYAVAPFTVSGTYVPQQSITGTWSSVGLVWNFSASYDPTYRQPASLASLAGSYVGSVASSLGWQTATVAIAANGAFIGSAGPGCSFNGTAAPRGSVNLFNISVHFQGGTCLFGTGTLSGIGYYDTDTRTLYAAAPNATRTDGFLFVGGK